MTSFRLIGGIFYSSAFPVIFGASLIILSRNHFGVVCVVQILDICWCTICLSDQALIMFGETPDGPIGDAVDGLIEILKCDGFVKLLLDGVLNFLRHFDVANSAQSILKFQ
jgi:hypothetical protein